MDASAILYLILGGKWSGERGCIVSYLPGIGYHCNYCNATHQLYHCSNETALLGWYDDKEFCNTFPEVVEFYSMMSRKQSTEVCVLLAIIRSN